MRMWMVNPKLLCSHHLLGEHREVHAIVGLLRKGVSLEGYTNRNLIEPRSIVIRHEELVREMADRGYNHQSPMTEKDVVKQIGDYWDYRIDKDAAQQDLVDRCMLCEWRYETRQREVGGV